jgi:hypothetical protein
LSLAEASSPVHHTHTLLHKTEMFLPRAFGPGESLDFWNMVLSKQGRLSRDVHVVGEYQNETQVI